MRESLFRLSECKRPRLHSIRMRRSPVRAIKAVGNYGEMYERNLGPKGAVVIPRENSLNRLWRDGGLLFSPSFQ